MAFARTVPLEIKPESLGNVCNKHYKCQIYKTIMLFYCNILHGRKIRCYIGSNFWLALNGYLSLMRFDNFLCND